MLSIRLTVTGFYVPFVPYWQGHVELILNVNWLDCHICRQLYCQPWDEQRYLSYRHLLVSLLTPIGGEVLSHCDFLALYCWCVQLRTTGFRIPALMVKMAIVLRKLSRFCAFYSRPTQDIGVIKNNNAFDMNRYNNGVQTHVFNTDTHNTSTV